MKYEITLPAVAQIEGRASVGRWRKEIGDIIHKGEIVLTIETNTMVLEIESEFEGMLGEIFQETGADIGPGEVLGIIEDDQPEPEEIVEETAEVQEEASEEDQQTEEATDTEQAEETEEAQEAVPAPEPIISARARWLAEASGVDVNALQGSGPGGRIIVGDVEAAIAERRAAADAGHHADAGAPEIHADASTFQTKQVPLTAIEQMQVQRMTQAHRDIPQYNILLTADATNVISWRTARREPPSITSIIVKLVAEALVDHPRLYGTFLGRSWRPNNNVNVAVAVDTPRGLMWPVLHEAQNQSLVAVNAELVRLAQKARDGVLTAAETTDANFMLTNLGMFNIEQFHGIIMPGFAAVLAVGAIQKEPRVVDDEIVARSILHYTLGCDRRIVEGAAGARFMERLKQLTEEANL